MFIKQIEVTEKNLMEVITDDSVYVIKRCRLFNRMEMVQIGDADVKDILADNAIIIKIIE